MQRKKPIVKNPIKLHHPTANHEFASALPVFVLKDARINFVFFRRKFAVHKHVIGIDDSRRRTGLVPLAPLIAIGHLLGERGFCFLVECGSTLSVRRLTRCALALLTFFSVTIGWGQSVTFSRSGVCTIYSADRRIRLVLAHIADASTGGIVDGALQATMVSVIDEKETRLWTRRIRGNIYDFARADSVVLSDKGDWFVALPGSNDQVEFGVYSAADGKPLDVPIRHPWVSRWIAGVERIG